jgi:hypothetical protein
MMMKMIIMMIIIMSGKNVREREKEREMRKIYYEVKRKKVYTFLLSCYLKRKE